jgi:hypothetical protein
MKPLDVRTDPEPDLIGGEKKKKKFHCGLDDRTIFSFKSKQ